MKVKVLITFFLVIVDSFLAFSDVTIQECVKKAEDNYPLIKKYALLDATRDIDLSDINKSWLPRIGAYVQVTGQNVVPSFPDALSDVLKQMGQNVKGLDKIQYKVGLDVTQTIWDGGVSKVRRKVAESNEALQKISIDVELYAVRERVEDIYFAILLFEKQIEQNEITCSLLDANIEKLHSMLKNGVAMQSDVDMLEAQKLGLLQNIDQAHSSVEGYRKILEIFIGMSLKGENLLMPAAEMPVSDSSRRPELNLFEKRLYANRLSEEMTETNFMPKIGLFAQAYYGYPGFDYFKSMMTRNLSFNILAGVRISWNIDSFYNKKNNYCRNVLNKEEIAVEKDLFLFNTSLKSASQLESIKGIRKIIANDQRIVELRSKVRKAAESQLENGIIDATALLTKITDENLARLNSKYHEIKYLQDIYKLKYILNQ